MAKKKVGNIFLNLENLTKIAYHVFYKKMGYNMKNCNSAKKYYEQCLSIPLYFGLTLAAEKERLS